MNGESQARSAEAEPTGLVSWLRDEEQRALPKLAVGHGQHHQGLTTTRSRGICGLGGSPMGKGLDSTDSSTAKNSTCPAKT